MTSFPIREIALGVLLGLCLAALTLAIKPGTRPPMERTTPERMECRESL